MTTPNLRLVQIQRAEARIGARLPDLYRDELIEDGSVAIDLPDGSVLNIYLNGTDDPAMLFADEMGYPIRGLAGWSDEAANWQLSKNAFIIAETGGGDCYLLSPDAQGIARRLVVTDHEEGALHIVEEDIENPQGWSPQRMPIEEQRRARIEAAEVAAGAVLPDALRNALIRDGRAPFPSIIWKDAEIVLAANGTGANIFDNGRGGVLSSRDWDLPDMENAHLAERGFWVFANGLGDCYLLVPDKDGIARVLVIVNHETFALEIEAQAIKTDDGMRWKLVTQKPLERVLDLPFVQRDTTIRPSLAKVPAAAHRRQPKYTGPKGWGPRIRVETQYPAFVFGLLAASIVSLVFLAIGIVLAFVWRSRDQLRAGLYAKAIRLFWWFVVAGVFTWGFKGAAMAFYAQGFEAQAITSMRASLVLGWTAQTLFTGVCLYQSIRLLWLKTKVAMPNISGTAG